MSDNQQPIALRLAEELETMFMETPIECEEAATLLREQHAEIERLRAELEALRNQEPVAWCATDESGEKVEALSFNKSRRRFDTPLYFAAGAQPAPSVPNDLAAAPEAPKLKPLTDEQIDAIMPNPSDFGMYQPPWSGSDITILRAMVRAVEAAHGIKENSNGSF